MSDNSLRTLELTKEHLADIERRFDPETAFRAVGTYLKLFITALLGMCLNMLSFFKGLELSTPVNSGIFATTNPIIADVTIDTTEI